VGGVNRIGLISIAPSGIQRNAFPLQQAEPVTFSNVRSFLESQPGIYLIGTRSEGLFIYDNNEQSLRHFKRTEHPRQGDLPENHITCIFKDSKGRIWIGVFGGGICLFHPDSGTFTSYNKDSGLPDNNICSIVESEDGHLWISSIIGISDFNPGDSTFRNYLYDNGININEFSSQSGIKLRNGTIIFGGNRGLISFNPENMNINPFIPPVVLENLYINNEKIIPGKTSSVLQQQLSFNKEIRLKHNQSNFAIEYSALNYIFPERNQYAYMLEGFDKDWNKVDNRRIAYYTNIPPGKYTFRVKASNNDGIWNEEGASIKIVILPPFWETWWAYSFYLLCTVFAFYLIFRYFKEKERLKNDIRIKQAEVRAQEEFHEARNRLFTNFSHELRTPLTLIMSPLDDMIGHEELRPDLKERMLMMQNNSHRLLRLVNNLMDFQKKESGTMELHVSKGDIIRFAKEMSSFFSETAALRNIRFIFHSTEESVFCFFDKNLMEKVFFNFLSNAFKNTPDKGRIEIRMGILPSFDHSDNAHLSVEFADTGIGIPAPDLEKIFMPFYQVSQSEHAHSGTGLGLSLSKSIIEMHHGKVWVESEEKKGATFKFVLPLSGDWFNAGEVEDSDSFHYTTEVSSQPLTAEENTLSSPTEYIILVVEDNMEMRRYITSGLAGLYKIIEASNGEEGIEKALGYSPDLIITDWMMPKMDGLTMTSKIKADIRTSHIPVIMITAKTTSDEIRDGYEVGADEYIVKPFNSSLLQVRVKNILKSREQLKEIYGKRFDLKTLGVKATSLDERFMQKLYEIMEKNISNPDLDFNQFYTEIGMSRANFYRKIKAITNLPLGEFIKNFRLKTAKELLSNENVSVTDVYVAVGFNSHAYFSNCFKAVYGVSPSEYARSQR
jgi:signal transduction histidine kinase/DNA-binding response OmpR family regulator